MKAIEEITKNFEITLNEVIENVPQILILKKEGRNLQELKEMYMRFYQKFLENPNKIQKNISNKMTRLEFYISLNEESISLDEKILKVIRS